MPKLPIDYSKGLIYTIKCKDETITEEYIGSTTNFNQRKGQHKHSCNNEKSKEYNLKKYQFIRDNGSWNNWNMIMIEEYSCENKRQLEMREEQIRVNRKASLNVIKSFGEETKEEYRKNYYEENKEKILEKKKEYYENNKEKIKEYYEENKQQISDYKKKMI
jgi:predicted GIY-YIG superfamily endonuclease